MLTALILIYLFHLLGIPERIDYAPSSGRVDLFPSAELQLCDVPCQVRQVDARVALTTAHIGKGCDRDTYSVSSQRKLCGELIIFLFVLPCVKLPFLTKPF